jgi:hypothetical protein
VYLLSGSALLLERNSGYVPILSGALSETTLRWRFFQFYRLLEHAYLGNVFVGLKDNFFGGPDEALKEAQRKLSNEFEQLKALVKASGLGGSFATVFHAVQVLIRNDNKFAKALFANIRDKGRDKGADEDKGIAFVYALRCSIAHSGVRDVYYEQYSDSDAVAKAVMPTLEEAVFQFLGVI